MVSELDSGTITVENRVPAAYSLQSTAWSDEGATMRPQSVTREMRGSGVICAKRAAGMMGVSVWVVYRLLHRRGVRGRRLGGRWQIYVLSVRQAMLDAENCL